MQKSTNLKQTIGMEALWESVTRDTVNWYDLLEINLPICDECQEAIVLSNLETQLWGIYPGKEKTMKEMYMSCGPKFSSSLIPNF